MHLMTDVPEDGVVGATLDGAITSWSHAAREIFGYTPGEILDRPIVTLLDRQRREDRDRLTDSMKSGTTLLPRETVGRHRQGSSIAISVSVLPIPDAHGQPIAAAVTIRDLARVRLIEESLRIHHDLLEALDDAVVVTNVNGQITCWNRAAEELYGWTTGMVIGRTLLDVLVPQTSPQQAQEIVDTLYRGRSWHGGMDFQRQDGSRFRAQVTDCPMRDERGALLGVIRLAHDATRDDGVHTSLARRIAG